MRSMILENDDAFVTSALRVLPGFAFLQKKLLADPLAPKSPTFLCFLARCRLRTAAGKKTGRCCKEYS